ncbi:MAG: alpha/beta hydrolase fold domain-containing protein, partial [Verrucomicrobia bacterium]|nr:alpha/beta hydrolase fold domain-containing protein [Verrucomicrobiota bacterium]
MDALIQAMTTETAKARFISTPSAGSAVLLAVVRFIDSCASTVLSVFSSSYKKNYISSLIAKEVLPSLALTTDEIKNLQNEVDETIRGMKKVEAVRFPVNKECSLDGVTLLATEKPMEERKVLVYFLPNYVLWQEKIADLDEYRNEYDADVICCNYRGCNSGDAFPANVHDLVNDGLLMVQKLLDKGVKPENIVVDGYSLGGGIALAVAAKLAQNGIAVNGVNERSFRSIEAVIQTSPLFYERLSAILVKAFAWNLSSEENIKKLSPKSKFVVIHNDNDEVIEYKASLKAALDERKQSSK